MQPNQLWTPNPLCPWVTVQEGGSPMYPRWKVNSVEYRDAQTTPPTDGTPNIYIVVLDDNGVPIGNAWVWQAWPPFNTEQTADKRTNQAGKTDFVMSEDSSFDPAKGQSGPYRVYMREKEFVTPTVQGLGMPLKRHVNYIVTFQLVRTEPSPIPPPSPLTLEETVKTVTGSVTWMPVNNGGALWKYAKEKALQDQQTDELAFMWNSDTYVAQVFNLGIVYAKQDDWSNIHIIPK